LAGVPAHLLAQLDTDVLYIPTQRNIHWYRSWSRNKKVYNYLIIESAKVNPAAGVYGVKN
jgi:hypothetical protein